MNKMKIAVIVFQNKLRLLWFKAWKKNIDMNGYTMVSPKCQIDIQKDPDRQMQAVFLEWRTGECHRSRQGSSRH